VPSVPNLKNDDHPDGRHHDRCGQYRQYRKHFAPPERQCPGTCRASVCSKVGSKFKPLSEPGQYPRPLSWGLKLE
jgi:hypothetical protein